MHLQPYYLLNILKLNTMKLPLKQTLTRIDATLQRLRPNTMEDLISITHSVMGVENYGTHFAIVKYKGYLQGIRVYVTGRKTSHPLPSKDKVYSVLNGVEEFENAGYPIEYSED